MANKPRRNNAAADAANTPNAADAASDNAANDAAILTVESVNVTDTSKLADAASIAPSADGTVELTPLASAQALLAKVDAALASLTGTPMEAALTDQRNAILGGIALLEAEAALQAERDAEESQAREAALAHNLPTSMLDAMLDAIDAKYAPVEPVAEVAAPAQADAPAERRAPSDRTVAANAAAASDTALASRSADYVTAFDADSGKLACTVNRRPNTRFSGMVALTPSGSGVANYADYDAVVRAIRAYLVNVKRWQVSPNDGQSVPEAKWLASRGRYILGGGVKSALACFHSGAEIAQYADGRFRFAYANTLGVKFLRTDNAAWQAFVGGTNSEQRAPVETHPNVVPTTTPTTPTPPPVIAQANGTLARTARCQHCSARNLLDSAECVACGVKDWLVGDNA